MADEKVVVELEVSLGKYIQGVQKGQDHWDAFTNAINAGSQKSIKSFDAMTAKNIKSLKRQNDAIKKGQAIGLNQVRKGLKGQTDAYDSATDKIITSLKRQQKEQDETASVTERSSRRIKGALTAALEVLSVGGVASFVKASLEASQAIEQQAEVAGVTVERYQELAFAADRFGISQEKVGDVLKDTQDKFGDFFNTGAGPLADFFDTIAP